MPPVNGDPEKNVSKMRENKEDMERNTWGEERKNRIEVRLSSCFIHNTLTFKLSQPFMDYETTQPHLFQVEKQDHNSAELNTVISNSYSPTAANFFLCIIFLKGL